MIKNNKGITIVALVVTIIILIILAGVSINMTLGEGGLITIAKRAKENMQLAQIEEQEKLNILYSQLEENGLTGEELNYDIIAKLNNFKKAIADYIEEAGGEKPDYTADAVTFGEKIKGIVAKVTEKTTAEEPQILQNYIAYSKGKLRTGTMLNQGAKTAGLNAGGSYTIPAGYHNGQGKITANSLASQTPATATEEDIKEGKTAWVNGNKIEGKLKDIGNSEIERGNFSGSSVTLSGYKYIIITSYYYSDSNSSIAANWTQISSCSGGTAECIINYTVYARLSMSTNLITCTNNTCTIIYNRPQDRAVYVGIK